MCERGEDPAQQGDYALVEDERADRMAAELDSSPLWVVELATSYLAMTTSVAVAVLSMRRVDSYAGGGLPKRSFFDESLPNLDEQRIEFGGVKSGERARQITSNGCAGDSHSRQLKQSEEGWTTQSCATIELSGETDDW